ncbi:MAG: 3-deoxy-D-manno-octulosonic acid transferase [Gemmataceae bacterium]
MRYLLDAVYLAVLIVALPWLVWRRARTGRYRHNVRAKLFGVPRLPRVDPRPAVWFHAVSVGEVVLLQSLVRGFVERHPDYQIVISSTTDTGLTEAIKRFPSATILPFPFDFRWAVERTLAAVQPVLIVLAEAELWPNFLAAASQRQIPVAVLNGRLSERSFRRFRMVAPLARRLLFRHLTLIAVQSEEYAERYRQLGVSHTIRTGNMKYDGAQTPPSPTVATALRDLIGDGPTLVVGSTHAPEEEHLLVAYQELRKLVPELRLILVPRHPDRFDEVARLLQQTGLHFQRRSQAGAGSAPILLLDTIGELSAAWSLADVGYVGGTLDGHRGGQSMIEPAALGVPCIIGPQFWNFRDAVQLLRTAEAIVVVPRAAELLPRLQELFENDERRRMMGTKAAAVIRAQVGATERSLDALSRLLPVRIARAA